MCLDQGSHNFNFLSLFTQQGTSIPTISFTFKITLSAVFGYASVTLAPSVVATMCDLAAARGCLVNGKLPEGALHAEVVLLGLAADPLALVSGQQPLALHEPGHVAVDNEVPVICNGKWRTSVEFEQ